MEYTRITFHNVTEQIKDVLIALLSEESAEGFEESNTDLIAYFPALNLQISNIESISNKLGLLYTTDQLPGQNWNAVWESNFHPVIVEDFCAIRANFHEPVLNVSNEIVITPKMSFGTGHHATTYMMILHMREIDFKNKKVLDFGTGTGVLAILADKLGASEVTAIDNDDWSIQNAAENFSANNTNGIKLIHGDSARDAADYDIVLANITRNVISDNFDYFITNTAYDAIILLSGLLEDDESYITEMASTRGLQLERKMQRDKWIAMRFSKRSFNKQ